MQAVGIAVEFCAHIVHAFLGAPGPRQLRAASALTSVGAAVISGIALTKLVGAPCRHRSAVFHRHAIWAMNMS